MKISSFIIALLVTSLASIVLLDMMTDLSGKYSVDFDNKSLEAFDNRTGLSVLTGEAEDATLNNDEQPSLGSTIVDIFGSIFHQGINALKATVESMRIFKGMLGAASSGLGLPSYFLGILTSIVTITIIIGVFLAAKLKWKV